MDINSKKLLELELIKARDEAEKASQLKSAFLANMSHEIRTPLGAMLGFTDLLRDPNLTATERMHYIDILSRNGESLAIIINDILDLSKVEAGHLTLEYMPTLIQEIVSDVISLLKVKAQEKNLNLEYVIEDSTPEKMTSDPHRVRQVLLNVIGNSIKFTSSGKIKIRVYGSREQNKDVVYFEISDTGIGIAPEQQENVFKNFVQADGSMTRRFGGTGLGLSLSRRLSRKLGGDLSLVQSTVGQGSTFLFKVPGQDLHLNNQLVSKPKKIRSETDSVLEGIKILVVEDTADNRQLIGHYLHKQKCAVDFAENGLIGYQKALKGQYDVVLMDIQMPEMDGYTATHNLREQGYNKPIIALTAHAMVEVKQKCISVGCTDHLSKPLNSKELINTIAKYV